MRVLPHLLYEIKKGVRNFAMISVSADDLDIVRNRIWRQGLTFHVAHNGKTRYNVFFGDEACVEVARMLFSSLEILTPEQDFMLGSLLGYDICQQSRRYLQRQGMNLAVNSTHRSYQKLLAGIQQTNDDGESEANLRMDHGPIAAHGSGRCAS